MSLGKLTTGIADAQVKAAGADWAPTGFQHPARRKEDVALPDEPGWSWSQAWQVPCLLHPCIAHLLSLMPSPSLPLSTHQNGSSHCKSGIQILMPSPASRVLLRGDHPCVEKDKMLGPG